MECNYGNYIVRMKEREGVAYALIVATISTGIVYGVVIGALTMSGKVFASICTRAGYTNLAARIALPVLLTNPWFVVAISVGIPAITLLIKTYKNSSKTEKNEKKEEEKKLNQLEKKAYEEITTQLNKKSTDCILRDNFDDKNIENILQILRSNNPDKTFCLCYLSSNDVWFCEWVRKELSEKELKQYVTVKNAIVIGNESSCIDSKDVDTDVLRIHLNARFPKLSFTIENNKKEGELKFSWEGSID